MDNHSLIFLWLFFICSIIDQTYAINCTFNEKEALISFKQSLSDPSAILSSWVVGKNCCEWYGITCDFLSGKVTKIDLRNSLGSNNYYGFSLGGEISPSLLQLQELNYLDLSLNNFNGAPIPHFFGMFKNLRYLNLSSAYFGGQIPLHLRNLSSLRYLDISAYNQFRYDDTPTFNVENLQWISGLSSLEYLDVGMVDLSRLQPNWMHAINTLSSLSELYLSYCRIQSFDTSIGFLNLTSLRILDLSHNWINSLLPQWLSNLTTLNKLDLSYNNLHGTIPRDFAKFKNLHYLDLRRNKLRNSGDHVPSWLRNLCKLQFLNLASNKFGGSIDELLGSSSSNCSHNSLEFLNLNQNELVGEIPNSIGKFENLQSLDLSENMLRGSLPNSIGNLSLLRYLDVSSNLFNGTIPPSFGQLSKLIEFGARDNSWKGVITEAQLVNLTKLESLQITTDKKQAFVFNVSYDWNPPFRLKTLYLRNCLVGPRFPVWLRVQTRLTHDVTISNAGICGSMSIRMWISTLSSQITSLDLSNNLLEGKLSHLLLASRDPTQDSISSMYSYLSSLYLDHNLLSGPIPSNIGDLMPKLSTLYLSNNYLNGTIPSDIKKMRDLRLLSLSNNQLSGELFDHWGEFKSLNVIDLANNHLHGKIPSSIGLLKYLRFLILNNNDLHGEIPKSLRNCSLSSIDLSENRLYGNLPLWIGQAIPDLMMINLRSNHFNGTIPRQWCNLPMLRVFDISNNNLSGEIPSCLNNWTTLTYYPDGRWRRYFDLNSTKNIIEKTTLIMKGRELEYDTILDYVLTIDLSRNRLSGEIPNEMTKLVGLGNLNLSNNELVGIIPKNIGAMQKLETLDLSNNHLSGRIPTSLGSLNFLTHLNLSFNNLSGRVPTGKQLQTLNDPSIYQGNPDLEIESSTSDKNTNNGVPSSSTSGQEESNDSEMFGFFISMAIGFPVGLNILFFTIFTSKSRRISYFNFVNRVSYNILEGIDFVIICMRRTRQTRNQQVTST